MLPPDTVIPKSKAGRPRKRKSPSSSSAKKASKKAAAPERPSTPDAIALDYESDEEDPGPDSDPETSLDVTSARNSTRPTTVHWDWDSPNGSKVGWKIKLWDDLQQEWKEGRIILYDPYTHKHKVQYDKKGRKGEFVDSENCTWVRLPNEVSRMCIALHCLW